VQITDTLEIEVIEYIYLTDTIVEVQFIDCNTGLPCEDDPIGSPTDDDCWPWSVYIPNTFTPNNDGWNDVWKIILDLGCWVDVEFRIYNRWGGLVFAGYGDDYESYPYWDGSMQGGPSYVADGVYVYTFKARRWNSPQVHQKNGHITIFR
jgi:gliding motility-associated-like protein